MIVSADVLPDEVGLRRARSCSRPHDARCRSTDGQGRRIGASVIARDLRAFSCKRFEQRPSMFYCARNATREDRLHARARVVDARAHRRADRRRHERRASQFFARQSRRSRADVADRAQRRRIAAARRSPRCSICRARRSASASSPTGRSSSSRAPSSRSRPIRACSATSKRVSTTYAGLPRDVKPGDQILLDDGYSRSRSPRSTSHEVKTRRRHRRRAQEQQGHQPARRRGLGARAVREGPRSTSASRCATASTTSRCRSCAAPRTCSRPSACSRSIRCRSR